MKLNYTNRAKYTNWATRQDKTEQTSPDNVLSTLDAIVNCLQNILSFSHQKQLARQEIVAVFFRGAARSISELLMENDDAIVLRVLKNVANRKLNGFHRVI
jgi:hypothetical protein